MAAAMSRRASCGGTTGGRRFIAVPDQLIYRSEIEAALWALHDCVALLREIRNELRGDGEEEAEED